MIFVEMITFHLSLLSCLSCLFDAIEMGCDTGSIFELKQYEWLKFYF